VGVVFTIAGIAQLTGAAPWGPRAEWPETLEQLMAAMRSQMAPFYAGFFQSVLVAHRDVVGIVAPLIHIVVGVALVLGLATRTAAAIALVSLLNYMAMMGVLPYHPNPVAAFAALALALLLTAPDHAWTIRTVLARRVVEGSAG
jgi:uncharacterized membrane protein YphA (DoxX/SURF4 family)